MPDSNTLQLVLIIAVFVAFLFFSSRKRKKQAETLNETVKVGANVVMLGGITGKIVSINNDTVVVESTPGTKIEFMKAAVRNVTAPEEEVTVKAPAKKAPVKKAAATKSAPVKKTAK
jgi:preprotein translocase subunit YajC